MGVESVGVEAAPLGFGPQFPHVNDHINRQMQGPFAEELDLKGVKFRADANCTGPYVFGSAMAQQATEGSNAEGTQSSSSYDRFRLGGIAGASSISSTGGSVNRTVSVSEYLAFRSRAGKQSSKSTRTVPVDPTLISSFSNFNIGSSGANSSGSTISSPISSTTVHPKAETSVPPADGTATGSSASGVSKNCTSSFSPFATGSKSSSYPRQFIFSAGTGSSKPTSEPIVSSNSLFPEASRPGTQSSISFDTSSFGPSISSVQANPTLETQFVNSFKLKRESNASSNSADTVTSSVTDTPKLATQLKSSDTDQTVPVDISRKLNQLEIDSGFNLHPKFKILDLNKDVPKIVDTTTSTVRIDVEQKLKNLDMDQGASLYAKLNRLDVNKDKKVSLGTDSFVFGSRSASKIEGDTSSGVPFVFGVSVSSPARSGSVPTDTDSQCPEAPPNVVPNLCSPFKFSADGEARPPLSKVKKDKLLHRPLRPGQRLNAKGKKSAQTNSRGRSDTTTPSPSRDGVPMDFSPQDSTLPSTSTQFGTFNLNKPLVPPYGEEDSEEESSGQTDLGSLSELEASIQKLRAAAVELNLGAKPDVPEENSSSSLSGKNKNEESSVGSLGQNWKRTPFHDAQTAERLEQDSVWNAQGEAMNSTDDRSKSANNRRLGSDMNYGNAEIGRDPEGADCSDSETTSKGSLEGKFSRSPFTFTASPSGMSTSNLHRQQAKKSHREKSVRRATQLKKPPGQVLQQDTNNSRPFPSIRSDNWSGVPTLSGSGGSGHREGLIPAVGSGSVAAEQVCERWRQRGNQAYAKGDFVKAEEYYSLGAGSVSPHETSQNCVRASMLCYSNRAATRMVVGRMREALADCMHAMAIDSSFIRVHLRAASCHLSLGETELAVLAFKECLRQAKEAKKLDSKVLTDASDGLKKAHQVAEYTAQVRKLLQNNSSGDAVTALQLLNEILLISPQSECLLELKACALISLQRHSEAVQLCEQSLALAEQNHVTPEGGSSGSENSPLGWRRRISAKANFHLGKLEESLELLQQLQEGPSSMFPPGHDFPGALSAEMAVPSLAVIRDLLRHKLEGNRAFQAGKHIEALEHYTAALARNGESRPFCAVCLCNRAAASQALGHIADAIADCSRAIALDPRYAKAISRRAALHEKVRDYGQSCSDLRRLIALYEKQFNLQGLSSHKLVGSQDSSAGSSSFTLEELLQVKERLVKSEEELKKGHPLDHYSILGLELGCSANEIKKAYRKAALRHHPDKAGQFLVRSGDIGDDTNTWKDVNDESVRKDGEKLLDEVRKDSEQLFKLIGEAYAVLSDPSKRSRYDAEEELRKLRTRTNDIAKSVFNERKHSRTNDGTNGSQGKGGWGSSGVGGESGSQSRASRQRERWEGFNYQYQRWHPGPDAAQPDVYARRGRPTGPAYGSAHRSTPWRWEEYPWDDV